MRPEAEGYVGSYVRAIHDFYTDLAGEVSLSKGEVFKVTKVIDKNWLQGRNNQKEGNFPTDFVEKLVLPLTDNGQKVFAASENFPAQQDGDLEFRKGLLFISYNHQSLQNDSFLRYGTCMYEFLTSTIFPCMCIYHIAK